MINDNEADPITLDLPGDEAPVLLAWVHRVNQDEPSGLLKYPAEQRALWNLECALERVVPVVMGPTYEQALAAARNRLQDDMSE